MHVHVHMHVYIHVHVHVHAHVHVPLHAVGSQARTCTGIDDLSMVGIKQRE